MISNSELETRTKRAFEICKNRGIEIQEITKLLGDGVDINAIDDNKISLLHHITEFCGSGYGLYIYIDILCGRNNKYPTVIIKENFLEFLLDHGSVLYELLQSGVNSSNVTIKISLDFLYRMHNKKIDTWGYMNVNAEPQQAVATLNNNAAIIAKTKVDKYRSKIMLFCYGQEEYNEEDLLPELKVEIAKLAMQFVPKKANLQ